MPHLWLLNKSFEVTSKAFKAEELALAAPAPSEFTGAQIRFQQFFLSSETYAALGAIDEEIYILRLRSIPGSAKAFALI